MNKLSGLLPQPPTHLVRLVSEVTWRRPDGDRKGVVLQPLCQYLISKHSAKVFAQIGRDIAHAIGWLAGHSIVHRDVSAFNIAMQLVGGAAGAWRGVVLDFGTAKVRRQSQAPAHRRGGVLGVPPYHGDMREWRGVRLRDDVLLLYAVQHCTALACWPVLVQLGAAARHVRSCLAAFQKHAHTMLVACTSTALWTCLLLPMQVVQDLNERSSAGGMAVQLTGTPLFAACSLLAEPGAPHSISAQLESLCYSLWYIALGELPDEPMFRVSRSHETWAAHRRGMMMQPQACFAAAARVGSISPEHGQLLTELHGLFWRPSEADPGAWRYRTDVSVAEFTGVCEDHGADLPPLLPAHAEAMEM